MDYKSDRITDYMVYYLSERSNRYHKYMRIPLTRGASNITDCMPWMVQCNFLFIFTVRRYAKRGICRRRVSVCVCVSVTLQYCIKMAKRRIMQVMPTDSPGILVFWHQSSRPNSNGISPYGVG